MANRYENAMWSIFGYLLSGLLFWGGIGYGLDKWLDKGTGVERTKTVLVVNECHFVPSDSSQRVEQPAQPAAYDGGDMPF